MAWLTVGHSNSDMCNKLIENGVINHSNLLSAFTHTDRGDFVIQSSRLDAYLDRPYRRDFIHMSAPHMYVTVLHYLDLQPGQAFLNVGSGSGYLSCLAACILGDGGVSHGIDVNAQVVAHSENCCKTWFEALIKRREQGEEDVPEVSREGVSFVHGNCFHIDRDKSTSCCKYDRIYIGAGCPSEQVSFFYSLLAEGGVMVVPVDGTNELQRIQRLCGDVISSEVVSHVMFAPLIQPAPAAISNHQEPLVTLPPVLWAPTASRFKQFPQSFKDAIKIILFHQTASDGDGKSNHKDSFSSSSSCASTSLTAESCCPSSSEAGNDSDTQHLAVTTRAPVTAATGAVTASAVASTCQLCRQRERPRYTVQLPQHLWTFILTFASRDWFVVPKPLSEILTAELTVERQLRLTAEARVGELTVEQHTLRRERDLYKMLITRLRRENQELRNGGHNQHNPGALANMLMEVLHEQGDDEDDEDEDDEDNVAVDSESDDDEDEDGDVEAVVEEDDIVAPADDEDNDNALMRFLVGPNEAPDEITWAGEADMTMHEIQNDDDDNGEEFRLELGTDNIPHVPDEFSNLEDRESMDTAQTGTTSSSLCASINDDEILDDQDRGATQDHPWPSSLDSQASNSWISNA